VNRLNRAYCSVTAILIGEKLPQSKAFADEILIQASESSHGIRNAVWANRCPFFRTKEGGWKSVVEVCVDHVNK
jgi:hypothetical protein